MAGKGTRVVWAGLVLFGMLAGLGSAAAGAASFSADMILDEAGTLSQGTLYVQDSRYRMELDNRPIAVLVDPDQGMTHLVIPDEKARPVTAGSTRCSILEMCRSRSRER